MSALQIREDCTKGGGKKNNNTYTSHILVGLVTQGVLESTNCAHVKRKGTGRTIEENALRKPSVTTRLRAGNVVSQHSDDQFEGDRGNLEWGSFQAA